MDDLWKFVKFDVELDKDDVVFLDREAARRSCTRNDLICEAVDNFIECHRHLLQEKKEGVDGETEASRTGHTAVLPPTAD